MNCSEVKLLARELGRASLMDAEVRRAALAHCETCAACAARVRDERTLNAGLKAWAAQDAHRETSERVEAELLAAFRQQKPAALPTSHPAATRPANVLHWRRWAIAAAVLLALSLLAFSARRTAQKDLTVIEPSPTPNAPVAPPAVIAKQDTAPAPLVKETGGATHPLPAAHRRGASPRLSQLVAQQQKPDAAPLVIHDGMTVYGEETEVVTDFVALDPADTDAPLESGQLLRVEVPRQTLARYGLPVNTALAEATVKADLLVGEDGRAHAIRFVR